MLHLCDIKNFLVTAIQRCPKLSCSLLRNDIGSFWFQCYRRDIRKNRQAPVNINSCTCQQTTFENSFINSGQEDFGWLVLLLYVPSQQLWSLRDGQFT